MKGMVTVNNNKINLIKNNKNFALIWLGNLVSTLGNNFHSIAVMWYVYKITGSPLQMGASLIFTELPYIVLGIFSGAIADRFDKRKIMIISDIVNGVLVGLIAVLIFNDGLNIKILYALSVCIASSRAFFMPAVSSLIPMFVSTDDIIEANSLNQISTKTCSIIAPALAGFLITVIGIPGLFILDSISYMLSGISECFISIKNNVSVQKEEKTNKFFDDVKEGFVYSWSNKVLLHYIIVGGLIINFFTAPLSIYIPLYSGNVLNMGSKGYGMLMSALSVGSLLAAAFTPRLAKKIGFFKFTTIGLMAEGFFILLFGISHIFVVTLIIFILMGISFGICNVCLSTVIQTIVPQEFLGRVSSIFIVLCSATVPLGYFIGGLAVEKVSLFKILVFSGICIMVAGLSTIKYRNKKVKKFHANS